MTNNARILSARRIALLASAAGIGATILFSGNFGLPQHSTAIGNINFVTGRTVRTVFDMVLDEFGSRRARLYVMGHLRIEEPGSFDAQQG